MIRVLICDDAVAFATLVRHWLAGCDDVEVVGTASSGQEALALAETAAPDVVILDHLLYDVPRGSEELGPLLRERLPDAAIVLMSGMADADLAEIAARGGADYFLSKASSPKALCAKVREAGASAAGG